MLSRNERSVLQEGLYIKAWLLFFAQAFQPSPQRSKGRKGFFVQSNQRALARIELYAIFEVALTLG